MVLTPDDGDAAITSWPCSRRFFTTFFPISPLPPMTTIFMLFSCPHAGCLKELLSLLGWNQSRNTLFFHQEHDELRRFAIARVAAHDMNVIRAFIECFTGFERDGLGASQLHYDRTLKHENKGMRILAMDFVR